MYYSIRTSVFSACTLNNIALVGGDLSASDGGGGLPTADPEECRYECGRRANCQFWTHVEEWQVNCFLKSVAGEERQMEGAITGWKGDGCGPTTTTTTTTPAPPTLTRTRPSGSRRRQPSRLLEAQRRRQQLEERRRQGLLDNTGEIRVTTHYAQGTALCDHLYSSLLYLEVMCALVTLPYCKTCF